ncbi:Magnesium transporter nipa2 [Hyphodiscus hymeniophilus]|uniref:Magnesium transporter nipa2 n=1 Tax=Hyphodiscus hymeniophilus TaxID=353542 RepID=A0A9P7AXQ5_9HELO|nr:Magnesium transporter nipa2 [Hyphodiscus hymeniophilus]
MDQAGHALLAANLIYARANTTNGTSTNPESASRPPVYKAIGISLAIASGLFIGVSFVLKKIGLLKANEKYNEAAGEGYGYLKNSFWWTGMTLMIIGEICNFVAYAFVDAILVTPLGALSVVITTILSAIFLKERLSMVGKVGCFLCIVGSVVIVMNAPSESSAATIQEMQHFVIAPGFLTYAGVVIIGCAFVAFWVAPRYGKKSMLVYLTICSLIGGLSVVATQGLGAAIVAQIGGTKQFNQWFLYVLFVFVITTLVTEIIFLNKALNLFNAALVTPTYYVYFTSSTIITSAILFKGFKGTPTSIITVVMGFFVICAGVVLLQLSKSAKDVPDSAVFAGDLDQVRTIAEQEQPESEPKADAIRGAAAIVRRFSVARQKMEMEEVKRLHNEKLQDLEPIGENEHIEWDGLRRRRTTFGTQRSGRSGGTSSPFPTFEGTHGTIRTPVQHPPLGMSYFPTESDLDPDEERPNTAGFGSSFLGSIRSRAKSMVVPGQIRPLGSGNPNVQSPMHPVPLTEISIPSYAGQHDGTGNAYYGHDGQQDHVYGLPPGIRDQKTEYEGAGGERHITIAEDPNSHRTGSSRSTLHPDSIGPTPPPHSARRQFSFQNVFRKGQAQAPHEEHQPQSRSPMIRKGLGQRKTSGPQTKGATEEEQLGLVKGDTRTGRNPTALDYEDEDYERTDEEDEDEFIGDDKAAHRQLTPPRREGKEREKQMELEPEAGSDEDEYYQNQRRNWKSRKGKGGGKALPPPPPPFDDGKGGAFI